VLLQLAGKAFGMNHSRSCDLVDSTEAGGAPNARVTAVQALPLLDARINAPPSIPSDRVSPSLVCMLNAEHVLLFKEYGFCSSVLTEGYAGSRGRHQPMVARSGLHLRSSP
jgi:hypothetical protein